MWGPCMNKAKGDGPSKQTPPLTPPLPTTLGADSELQDLQWMTVRGGCASVCVDVCISVSCPCMCVHVWGECRARSPVPASACVWLRTREDELLLHDADVPAGPAHGCAQHDLLRVVASYATQAPPAETAL